jgi:hypothetical protein
MQAGGWREWIRGLGPQEGFGAGIVLGEISNGAKSEECRLNQPTILPVGNTEFS